LSTGNKATTISFDHLKVDKNHFNKWLCIIIMHLYHQTELMYLM